MTLRGRIVGVVAEVDTLGFHGSIRVAGSDGELLVPFDLNSFLDKFFKMKPGDQVSLYVNEVPTGKLAGGLMRIE